MSDLARALADIAADPNVGVAATWTGADGGAPRSIRVTPAQRDEPAFGPAGRDATRISVRIDALAIPGRPQRGDALSFGGQGYRIEAVRDGMRGLFFTCILATTGPA